MRNERNLGFAGGVNVGLRAATGDVLVLLNQDTIVRPGWLAALVRALLQLHVNYWDDDARLTLLAERCGAMATRIDNPEARLAQAQEKEESSRGYAHE